MAASLTLITAAAGVAMLTGSQPAAAARITASCSNSNGDAVAIQTAINNSAPGDEIVIDGPCLIINTIELLGNRAYRGDSASTVLKEADGRNLAAVLASDSWFDDTDFTGAPITLRDLVIDANKIANPTGGDAVVIRSWRTTIERLTIQNARANGLRITNTSRNNVALDDPTHTQVNGSVRNIFVTGSGQNGIFIHDTGNAVSDWNLTDNWVADSGGDAIKLDNSAGWTIERNHVYGVAGTGINASRLFGSSVSDNYIEDFGVNGIGVTVQGDVASTITDNRVFQMRGSGTTYLAIKQVNYGSGQVGVVGNAVRGNGSGTGLSYQRGSHQLTVTSAGNSVMGVTTQRAVGAGVTVNSGV
jgi:hypothetical protein